MNIHWNIKYKILQTYMGLSQTNFASYHTRMLCTRNNNIVWKTWGLQIMYIVCFNRGQYWNIDISLKSLRHQHWNILCSDVYFLPRTLTFRSTKLHGTSSLRHCPERMAIFILQRRCRIVPVAVEETFLDCYICLEARRR